MAFWETDKQVGTITSAILLSTLKDLKGIKHVRYQQLYNNNPVEGAIYIVHVASGKVKSENVKWIENIPVKLELIKRPHLIAEKRGPL